jgi:hypothetical protein
MRIRTKRHELIVTPGMYPFYFYHHPQCSWSYCLWSRVLLSFPDFYDGTRLTVLLAQS